MEDKLRLNTKLFGGFDGIIGRRDFLLNSVYIASINILFFSVLFLWVLYGFLSSKPDVLYDIFFVSKYPLLIKIWLVIGSIVSLVLTISNNFRRLNDIFGKVNKFVNILSVCIVILPVLSYFFFSKLNNLFGFLYFIFWLFLLFKTGKITSKYPYDFLKEFNWGAFLGTWIWGLFNKSYKTLWQLIIGFTPWNFYYALICGLKGNKWAYKNTKCKDVDDFNQKQEKQATIFAFLSIILVPLSYILFVAAFTGTIMFFVQKEIKNNPDELNTKLEAFLQKFDDILSLYYDSYEITDKENKFYVIADDWDKNTNTEKIQLLNDFASMAAVKRSEESKTKSPHDYKVYSKYVEISRTKVYDKETGKLLGEYIYNPDSYSKDKNIFEKIKSQKNSYHFYELKK